MKITKIEKQKNKKNRYSIFLDDNFAFGINEDVLIKESLFSGKDLTDQDVSIILRRENYQKCLNKAYDFLSRRMHSEQELRIKLYKTFESDSVVPVLVKLKEMGYLNDFEFAKMWVKNRSFQKGNRFISQELRQKGVEKQLIERALDEVGLVDSEKYEVAYKLALKKYKEGMSNEEIYKKVGPFLTSRGFDYDLIKRVINEIKNLANK